MSRRTRTRTSTARSRQAKSRLRGSGWRFAVAFRLLAALVDGKEAVFDGQREHRHGGRIVRPDHAGLSVGAVPRSVLVLPAQQKVVQVRAIAGPVRVSELEHRLRVVIEPVKAM